MPTTRGWTVLTAGVLAALAGWGAGVEEYLLVAVAAGGLLVVGATWAAVRARSGRRHVTVTLGFPTADVPVGAVHAVRVAVATRGGRPVVGLALDDPARRFLVTRPGMDGGRGAADPGHGGRRPGPGLVPVPPLEPGPGWSTTAAVPTRERGLLRLEPVRAWVTDPFGLVVLEVAASLPAHLVVHPVPAAVDLPDHLVGEHAGPPSAPTRSAGPLRGEPGEELSDLRPYQPGDRLSRLHWPSMAGRGELLVRDFLPATPGRLTLLVDLRTGVHGRRTLEPVVDTAAGLGVAALRRGRSVDLRTSAGDRAVVAAGTAGPAVLLRALALLEPTDRRTAPAGSGRPTREAPVGPVVVVTTRAGRDDALPTGGRTVHTVVPR